jgi:hypothetical protein
MLQPINRNSNNSQYKGNADYDSDNEEEEEWESDVNNAQHVPTSNASTLLQETKWLILILAATLIAVRILAGANLGFAPSISSNTASKSHNSNTTMKIAADSTTDYQHHIIADIRRQIVQLSQSLQQQQQQRAPIIISQKTFSPPIQYNNNNNNDTDDHDDVTALLQLFDTSAIYQVVSNAIDLIGVVGLYFDVFDNGELEWWFDPSGEDDDNNNRNTNLNDGYRVERSSSSDSCWETHGMNDCGPWEPWWLYHYIGAATAKKLMNDGHIVWKPDANDDDDIIISTIPSSNMITIIQDATTMMRQLHVEQDRHQTTAGDMSYHAQHGMLWELLPKQHDFVRNGYPFALADAYCGDYYGHTKVRGSQAHRSIGSECFHGIGHATFMAVAKWQLQLLSENNNDDHDDSYVLFPSTGFQFTPDAWCAVYQVCSATANLTTDDYNYYYYSTNVQDRCFGGVRHSVMIFAKDSERIWRHDTDEDETIEYFFAQMEHCK